MKQFHSLTLAFLFLLPIFGWAQSVVLDPFSNGYNWLVGIENDGVENQLYIIQQNGYIFRCDSLGVKQLPEFLNISTLTASNGERGLLGLAFHPNYAENGLFYVNYTMASGGDTRIARYQRSTTNPLIADPSTGQVLLTIDQPYANHNGGCIKFGRDGYLHIGMGDGGAANDPQNRAQDPASMLGKMLRLDVNVTGDTLYKIPADNPFLGSTDTLEEIWTLGWRNPWRFSFDRLNGDLWSGDVGQNAVEEVDFEPYGTAGGQNYGWRCYEASNPFNTSGCGNIADYVEPIFSYNHSSGNGCSITGGNIYRGALFSSLFGKYLMGDYCSGRIWALTPDGIGGSTGVVVAEAGAFVLSSFGEDVWGELYATNYTTHNVSHLTIANDAPVAYILADTDTLSICTSDENYPLVINALYHPTLSYQWFLDGVELPTQTTANLNYAAAPSGSYTVEVTNPDGLSSLSTPFVFGKTLIPTEIQITGTATAIWGDCVVLTYSCDLYEGATYNWTVENGIIISGQGTNAIEVTWNDDAETQRDVQVAVSF
jgi:Glucose / Sorbosone dehydrogenase/PKD-like domain